MGGTVLVVMVAMMVLMCGGMMTAGVLAVRAWRRTPGRGADPATRDEDGRPERGGHHHADGCRAEPEDDASRDVRHRLAHRGRPRATGRSRQRG